MPDVATLGRGAWHNECFGGAALTLETKTLISPADITAVHYRCSCGSSQVIPVSKEHSVPDGCEVCGVHWFDTGDSRQNDIYRMVSAIRAAQVRVSEFGGTGIGLQVALEIDACGKSN